MNRLILRVQILFFVALAAVGVWFVYQQFFVLGPVRACEKHGGWYDPKDHVCAHVLYLPNITHRNPSDAKIPAETTARKSVGAVAKPAGK